MGLKHFKICVENLKNRYLKIRILHLYLVNSYYRAIWFDIHPVLRNFLK